MIGFGESKNYLAQKQYRGMNFGLDRVKALLANLGNPHLSLTYIHVAGTNGKGSTVQYIHSILLKAGYTVGAFTSPAIESIRDHITLNKGTISEEAFASVLNDLIPYIDRLEERGEYPTEFEILTVMSFYYFSIQKPDFVLLEAGLGGKSDSTNVISPILSIITNVGQDHMNILGDTIKKIAEEKAGIIKPGIPVILGDQKEDVITIIKEKCKQNNSELFLYNNDFFSKEHKAIEGEGERFNYHSNSDSIKQLTINMKGEHQIINASLAIKSIETIRDQYFYKIEDKHIRKGLEDMQWKGRFEKISDHPTIYVDGAHNPEGIQELIKTVKNHFKEKKITVMFSALADKKLDTMVPPLLSICERMIYTSFEFSRAASAKQLMESNPSEKAEVQTDFKLALDTTLPMLKKDEVLLITGSLYFIAEVRKYLLYKNI